MGWESIPLHIRCTERRKIDPTYPDDDATWWRLSERLARREDYSYREPHGGLTATVVAYASKLSSDGDELAGLAGACRVSSRELQNAIKEHRRGKRIGESRYKRVYEEMSEAEIRSDKWLASVS